MEVQKEYLQSVPLEQPISIAELQKKAKRDVSGGDFVSYFKERLNTYENGSTRRTLEKVLTKLEANLKGKELYFTEINHDFLDNYVIHLRRVLGNSDSTRGSEYIFPFLKKGEKIDSTSKEDAQKLESITATINKNLKKIASEIGIEKNISSHVARHSFAYTARKRTGNDIYAIQKALGHSSVSVTENYFGSEETIEADNLTKLMFE